MFMVSWNVLFRKKQTKSQCLWFYEILCLDVIMNELFDLLILYDLLDNNSPDNQI